MINWKGFGRKQSWPSFKVQTGIHLEGIRENIKNLSG
jgi:hypothetical protein